MNPSDAEPAPDRPGTAMDRAEHAQDSKSNAPRVERIESRFRMAAGEYWREKASGDVRLIAEVRMDGDRAHRVDLYSHPREGANPRKAGILVEEFLSLFEPAPDGEEVRNAEVAEILAESAAVSKDIADAQSNPAYLNMRVQQAIAAQYGDSAEKGGVPALPEDLTILNALEMAPPSLSRAIEDVSRPLIEATLNTVRSAQQVVAAQGQWFAARSQDLARLTQSVVPFYQERALVPIARSASVLARAESLQESVQTLNLFLGDGVDVTVLRDGEPADASDIITLYQRKLWIDEEMSYLRDYHDNDVSSLQPWAFHQAIAENDDLINLLVPARRGAVLVGLTREPHRVERNDLASRIVASMIEEANRASFLLVRDGDRVLMVSTQVPSHVRATRLFPEVDIDGGVFTGLDGTRITPEDLRWTDRLDQLHSTAVHYRRFAVILAGLVSRQELWADVDFRSFFDAAAHEKTVRLLRDDSGEGVLCAADGSDIDSFLKETRSLTVSGSRIVVDLGRVVSLQTAPRAFDHRGELVTHDLGYAIKTLERDKGRLFFRHKFTRSWSDRLISAQITLFNHGRWLIEEGWICIDRINPARLDALMARRSNRMHRRSFMGMMALARKEATRRWEEEADLRSIIVDGLMSAKFVSNRARAIEIAGETLAALRCNNGGELPSGSSAVQENILNAAFRLTERGTITSEEAERALEGTGSSPLRLELTTSARVFLYATPSMRDEIGGRHIEVDRYEVVKGARGVRIRNRKEVILPNVSPTATTLHEWDSAPTWAVSGKPKSTLPGRVKLRHQIAESRDHSRRVLMGQLNQSELRALLDGCERVAKPYVDRHKRMPCLMFSAPIGLVGNRAGHSIAATLIAPMHSVLRWNSRDNRMMETWIKTFWSSCYAKKVFVDARLEEFRSASRMENATKVYWFDNPDIGVTAGLPRSMSLLDPHQTNHQLEKVSRALGKALLTAPEDPDLNFGRDESTAKFPYQWWPEDFDARSTSPLMGWLCRV